MRRTAIAAVSDTPAQLAAQAARRALAVLLGVAVLSAASWAHLPFWATLVPFTLQPQAVIAVAALLAPGEGVVAVLAWFAASWAGLPVLANAAVSPIYFVGPTAGYLWSYPLVAWAVGRWGRGHSWRSLAGWGLAAVLTLAMGAAWLAVLLGGEKAWQMGVLPFVAPDACKLLAAWLLLRGVPAALRRARHAA